WAERAQPQQARLAADAHIKAGDATCEATRTTGASYYVEMKNRPFDSDWYAARSVYPIASRIKTPTYIVFGWQDQNVLSRAIGVFDELRGPKRMLLAESGHSFYIRSMQVRRQKLQFLDYWLRGRRNGIMDGKPIEVWLTMKGSVESIPDRIDAYDRIP